MARSIAVVEDAVTDARAEVSADVRAEKLLLLLAYGLPALRVPTEKEDARLKSGFFCAPMSIQAAEKLLVRAGYVKTSVSPWVIGQVAESGYIDVGPRRGPPLEGAIYLGSCI